MRVVLQNKPSYEQSRNNKRKTQDYLETAQSLLKRLGNNKRNNLVHQVRSQSYTDIDSFKHPYQRKKRKGYVIRRFGNWNLSSFCVLTITAVID